VADFLDGFAVGFVADGHFLPGYEQGNEIGEIASGSETFGAGDFQSFMTRRP